MRKQLILIWLLIACAFGCQESLAPEAHVAARPSPEVLAAADTRCTQRLAEAAGYLPQYPDSAIAVLSAALADSALLSPQRNIEVLSRRAEALWALQDHRAVLHDRQQALRILSQNDTLPADYQHTESANQHHSLANQFARLGLQDSAIAHARAAIHAREAQHGRLAAEAMKSYTALAQAYQNRRQYDSALAVRAIVVRVRDSLPSAPPKDRFVAHFNYAEALADVGDLTTAAAQYAVAETWHSQLTIDLQAQYAPLLADHRARLHLLRHDTAQALAACNLAMHLATQAGEASPNDVAARHITRGNLFRGQRLHKEALADYTTAFEALTRLSHIRHDSLPSVFAYGTNPNAVVPICLMARTQLDIPDSVSWAHGLACYDSAFAFLNLLRHGFGNNHLQANLTPQLAPEFEFAMYAAVDRGQFARAFEWMEEAKENALLDLLQALWQPTMDPLPADTVALGTALQAAWIKAQAACEAGDLGACDSAHARHTRLEALEHAVRKRHPGHIKVAPDLATRAAVQARLQGDSSLLVSYYCGPQRVVMAAIGGGRDTFLVRPISQAFLENLLTFRRCLSDRRATTPADTFAAASHGLYACLVEPIFQAMGGKNRWKTLVVVPDALLAAIPFEALVSVAQPPRTPYDRMPFLIRDLNVQYAQSATLYCAQVSTGATSQGVFGLGASQGIPGWRALPSVPQEISDVVDALGGTGMVDAINAERLIKQGAHGHGVLHIASHGSFDPQVPLHSRLLLHGQPADGEDGELHAYEVMQMQLPHQMAVLSACETGLAARESGGDMIGIGYAFHLARCSTVVMSLWNVDDELAAGQMQVFYQGLAAGRPAMDALGEAKRQHLLQADGVTANPAYWAPFVLMGDGDVRFAQAQRPLKLAPWLWVVAWIAAIAGAAYAWRRRRKFRWT